MAWAGSDGAGGVVYGRDGVAWWLPANSSVPVTIDADAPSAAGGRLLYVDPNGEPCDEGELERLMARDLPSGQQRSLGCRGGAGDSWFDVVDVAAERYLVEEGMDLADYATISSLSVHGIDGNQLTLPGNPYPTPERCRVDQPGDLLGACEVHGRLSPDGRLLATWYRPDFAAVVAAGDTPPEVVADEQAWLSRLDTLGAELTVDELDRGTELYSTVLAG